MKTIESPASSALFAAGFPGLLEVEEALHSIFAKAEGVTRDICLSLNSGGKRIRPALVILSGLCFSDLSFEMVNTGVAAELIHMASLVHDDVIDKSFTRRGKRSVNAVYGNRYAVLAGDFLFAKAFSILSSYNLAKSMKYFTDAIEQMCDGELNQAEDSFDYKISIDRYFKRIAQKTGILISSCCRSGASVAGADDEYVNILRDYGMDLGCAFQIIDDILDFNGDETKLGKPVGNDIANGDITLPVILLIQNPFYNSKIIEIINAGQITKDSIKYINDMLKESGAMEKAYEVAKSLINRTKSRICNVPDSIYRSYLIQIADGMLNRKA
jgi:heptaprenyl diphosphate synthase